jgi:hypothetical protein
LLDDVDDGYTFVDYLEGASTGGDFLGFSLIPEIAVVDIDIVSDLGDAVGRVEIIKVGGLLDGRKVESSQRRRFDLCTILENDAQSTVGLLPT